jgi:predicted RND superfamily exporter protein
MKITVTHYDQTIIVHIKGDDLTMEDMLELFRKLSLAMGYHPDVVDEYLPNE